jgi:hypothetical protein
MATEVLGTKMRIAGFGCLGTVAPQRIGHVLAQITALAGMDRAGMDPQVWVYPLPDGRGGTGITAIQPWVESFLAVDTWPALEHKGKGVPKVYVAMASCRPFSIDAVCAYLSKEIGPVVRRGYFEI